ncbi:hypothetical protein PSPO01_16425 [Paraphaeosphaeria sporulosa]
MATQGATATITGPNDQGLQVNNNPGTINYSVYARAGTSLPYLTCATLTWRTHRSTANLAETMLEHTLSQGRRLR